MDSEDRAELSKLLDIVCPGDTIIATEVSRITRSTKQLCEIIEFAKAQHIKLIIVDDIMLDEIEEDCEDAKSLYSARFGSPIGKATLWGGFSYW